MNKEYPSLYLGDCLDIMRTFPDNVVDSIVTDPPYGIEFLGKEWDRGVPGAPFWEEMLRIAKPGAILLAMGGTRTYHRLVCAIEDAGWEIRDTIAWVYGCLSEDTEILTINGWKRYHRDIDRSSVLCYNIDSGTFEFYVPSRSFIYENKHTAYHIQSDYTDQIVSRNHRCIVERDGRKVFAYAETLEQQESVPILESLRDLPDAIYDHESYSSIEKEVLLALCNTSAKEEKTTNRAQVNVSHLLNLRQRILQAILLCKENCEKLLLLPVQRRSTGTGLEAARSQGKGVLDCRIGTKFYRADDGRHESRVERRSNLFQKAWELCSDKVCSLSERISGYVSQRRLCYGASVDCGSISGALSCENRSRSSYQSRPDGQQAGKSDAIQEQPRTQTVRRTRATVTPIEYEGNVWCVEVPTGAFVARRNGKIFITGNSGFPKSYNISKGIDKQAGAEREVVGQRKQRANSENSAIPMNASVGDVEFITAPATPAAQLWHGWGTALKPAMELICVAMKPIDGTYVNNALTWGVAGLWIDGGRVGTDTISQHGRNANSKPAQVPQNEYKPDNSWQGRFPANVIHDGSDEVMGLFPMTTSTPRTPTKGGTGGVGVSTNFRRGSEVSNYRDSGSAARFFMACKQDDLCSLCLTPKHSIMSDIDNSEVIRCKNISANNVEKNLTTTQATIQNIAQENVPDWLIEKAVHFAKSVGNLCDSCATSIVREVAEVKTWDFNKGVSPVIQGFIGNSNKCILTQNLAHYAGLMESIDTTPTTTSLSKLFGCASRVITNYIQETEKTAPKRFLYTAKASRSERNAGLEGMEEREWHGQMPKNDPNYVRSDGAVRTQNLPRQNHHPTVKPLALLRYLARLTKTPTGGVILDPFMGSGTTGMAAVLEGRDFIGIELNPEYLEIAERRIAEAQKQPRLL